MTQDYFKNIERFLISKPDEDHCYNMGYDCGMNGANTTNCAIGLFSTRERTKAWERGKADAEASKNKV